MTGKTRITAAAPWMLMGALLLIGAGSWRVGGPLLMGACASVWLMLAFYAGDLRTPRGWGAWALWAFWAAFCGLLSREPELSAGTIALYATGVLILVLCFSWWGDVQRKAWLYGLWVLAPVVGGLSVYRGSAGPVGLGLLAAAVGSSAAAVTGSCAKPMGRRRAAGTVLPLSLVLLGLFFHHAHLRGFSDRAAAWRDGARVAAANPLKGTGPGLFDRGQRLVGAPRRGWVRFAETGSSPSDLVGAAAETGVIGLILLLIAFYYSLTGRRPDGADGRNWERRAAAGACVGLALVSAVSGMLAEPGLIGLWFSALAMSSGGGDEEELSVLSPPSWAGWVGAAACLLCFLPAQRMGRGSDAPGKAEFARLDLLKAPPEWGRALGRLRGAARLSPRNAVYRLQMAQLYAAQGALPEAVVEAERAVALEPHFAAADLLLCEIFARDDDMPRAKRHWERMMKTLAAGFVPDNQYKRWLLEVDPERVFAVSERLSAGS